MLNGLLGDSLDDPRTLGLLQMAAALSSGRKFMPALAQGLLARQQVVQGAAEAEEAKKDRALRRGLLEIDVQKAKQAQERQAGIDGAYRQAFRTPEQMAMAAHGGPTMAAAQAAPSMAPGFDQNALLRGLALETRGTFSAAGARQLGSREALGVMKDQLAVLKEISTAVNRPSMAIGGYVE
jgi:hypothetical protein